MNTIKICFIGAGGMSEEHIKAFKDIPEVQIVGIQSRTISKAEQLAIKYNIPHVHSTINEMYNVSGADLVVIAVSELSVRQVCLEAFEFPWTCLVEKPAGYDLVEAETIAAAAREKKRKVFVIKNQNKFQ